MHFMNRALLYSPIEYGLCLTEEDFVKTLKKLGMPHVNQPEFCSKRAGATTHFFEGIDGSPDIVIVTMPEKEGYTVPEVHSLLAHEAVHVWQHIKIQLGEKCSIDQGAEVEAYAIQNISYNLMIEYEDAQYRKAEKLKKAKAKAKADKAKAKLENSEPEE